MLSSKLLTLKPTFLLKTGVSIINFVKRTFDRNRVDSDDVQILVMEDNVDMRPDLMSKAAYQTDEHWDALLKFNGISNPFSLDHKQIIFIPSQNSLSKGYYTGSDIEDHAEKKAVNQILNPVTKQDKKRLELLKSKPLPNNIVDATDKNVKVKDGKIVFGEDVTKVQKEKCTGSVSRAKLKERLLQNQIFTD